VRQIVTPPAAIDDLVTVLRARGYRVIGPRVRDGAVVYDEVEGLADLPIGWGDDQAPGHYRLRRRDDAAAFGYVVGPQSWKRWLLPPRDLVFSAERNDGQWAPIETNGEAPRFAFLGVRACELAAIAVQDRVFLRDTLGDTTYALRRRDIFTVAVDCAEPASTCFCTSMGTGPAVRDGADLVITELLDSDRHELVIRAGSEAGDDVLAEVDGEEPTSQHHDAVDRLHHEAEGRITRTLETDGLKELLREKIDDERWDEIARRCLACANCTLVCPTCFCTSVDDVTALDGSHAERWQRWDSCFSGAYSQMAGHGPMRVSTSARYRQWMTHKFSTWFDQFGTSGCIGCGRCITWCPVGIDITAELAGFREEAVDA
jgi:sulfhydrogenase subunit beta (sulfur reductase)